MWPDRIVMLPPLLDENLGLVERREQFTCKQLVSELGFEALAVTVLPWATRSDEDVYTPIRSSQPRTLRATNSGPLSERTCSGGPWATKRSVRQWSTSSDSIPEIGNSRIR